MMPATNYFTFVRFLFSILPCVVPLFRRLEKCSIKAHLQKERVAFLHRCVDEKVVPRSLHWVYRTSNKFDPFPEVAKLALNSAIREAKEARECFFYELRKARRDLRSQLHDPALINDIEQAVHFFTATKTSALRSRLDSLVDRLCFSSLWSKFSCTDNVINLSDYSPNHFELEVLGFGLNFALPANRSNFSSFVRNLSFLKNDLQTGFISSFLGSIYKDLSSHQAFPKRYSNALKSLKNNKMIHISPADKGGKVVILNSSDYNNKLMSIFLNDPSTYKPVSFNPLNKMQSEFNKQLKQLSLKYPDSKNFILSFKSFLPSLPYAYGLPKLHKPNCPLRPIISNINSPSYKLSKTVASILSPFLGSFSSSHLKHSGDLLCKLRLLNLLPSDKFISFDAVSLFTNVPLEPTLDFLSRKLPSINPSFPTSIPCLLDLIRLVSSNSFFSCNGLFFQQVFGFAMGNPLSPVLSNFFLEHVETELLSAFSGSKPFFFVRYVDDILAVVHSDFNLASFVLPKFSLSLS